MSISTTIRIVELYLYVGYSRGSSTVGRHSPDQRLNCSCSGRIENTGTRGYTIQLYRGNTEYGTVYEFQLLYVLYSTCTRCPGQASAGMN